MEQRLRDRLYYITDMMLGDYRKTLQDVQEYIDRMEAVVGAEEDKSVMWKADAANVWRQYTELCRYMSEAAGIDIENVLYGPKLQHRRLAGMAVFYLKDKMGYSLEQIAVSTFHSRFSTEQMYELASSSLTNPYWKSFMALYNRMAELYEATYKPEEK